jgi:riboflavin transporter FmnP
MYSWIWSKLPGGKFAKTFIVIVLLAALSLFMFMIGFPAIEDFFNVDQTTITE